MAIFALIKPQKHFLGVDRIMKYYHHSVNNQFDDQNWKGSFKFSLRLNMQMMRIPYAMSPMKNPKRPFYDFYIKFMMYLEHSS